MSIRHYQRPETLEDLISESRTAPATILAGGTDLQPRWARGITEKPESILDVKQIEELHGIERLENGITVGACTVMSELATDPVIRAAAPMLAEAAGRVACPQIRNRATLGGNLCNASPAADTAVPLILLDAVLRLARPGPDGIEAREVPITDFFVGPGATYLTPGETLTRVRFDPVPADWFWAWEKFGTRPAMEISVASVGVLLAIDAGVVTRARVGYGSVAPTPLRGHQAEAELVEHSLSDEVIARCVAAAQGEVSPITDVRASGEYRRRMVGVLLKRMLEHARPA